MEFPVREFLDVLLVTDDLVNVSFVRLTQLLLAEPDQHRGVTVHRLFELLPPDTRCASCSALIQVLLNFGMPFFESMECLGSYPDERSDLLVERIEHTELTHLDQEVAIHLYFYACGQILFLISFGILR